MGETSISCVGCGACCEQVGYPPFADIARDSDERFTLLAQSYPDLAAEIRAAALARRREQRLPCIWLEPATRHCRHYNVRPQACRDFELGSPKCLELRWLRGIQ
jgi:Fe-S-cluster containining protein